MLKSKRIAVSAAVHRFPVCTENLNPNVLTMKSAQYGARIYDAGSPNRARDSGTPDGVHSTAKLRKHAIARRVGDAASMGRNEPVQDFPTCREGIQGSNLIGPHEAAIALHVSRKDSGQPALPFNGLGQGHPGACGFRGVILIRPS